MDVTNVPQGFFYLVGKELKVLVSESKTGLISLQNNFYLTK